jgi:sugar lactone lactonase YvrE
MTTRSQLRGPRLGLASLSAAILPLLSLLLLMTSACATQPVKREPAVFFPPAPALPRIQFLTAFNGLKDIEEQSGFDRFVVGEKLNLELDKPYGVAMYDGKIYVCDTNTTVIVLDLAKKQFSSMAGAVGPGRLSQPVNISIEADGTKYVSDPVRGQVVVFDKDDVYLRAIGEPGTWKPVDAVPFGDRLYVADNANGLVKIFDKLSGELLKAIGDKGDPTELLDRPTNLAFDAKGYLYVTDIGRFQVVKFDRDGHFQSTIGKAGDSPGHFARPKGTAIDREGRLFAVDAAFNNVQIFSPEGRVLMFFGDGGVGPGGLMLPAKVALDEQNLSYFRSYAATGFEIEYLVLVTSQFGDRKVSVYGFGHEKERHYPTEEELRKQIDEKRRKELEKLESEKPKGEASGEALPESPKPPAAKAEIP